jgi:hypothetical protein
MINSVFIAAASIAYLMLAFYKTSAFVEYCRLFGIRSVLRVGEYFKFLDLVRKYPTLYVHRDFLEWLQGSYGNVFIYKLVLCPVCSGFYLALISGIFVGFSQFLAVAFLANIFYYSIVLIKKFSEN